MNISIVIPNYNGTSLLRNNLPKVIDEIRNYQGGSYEVIVIDDGSSDDSTVFLEQLAKKEDKLRVFKNNKNYGFSTSVNRGVRLASGEVVILLNTDVYPEKGFLAPLLKHFINQNIFAVACMDKSLENGATVLRGRGLGGWRRGFMTHRRGEVDKTDTLWASGGSSAFRKLIWEKMGGLSEIYNPFYWEDIDLSYRALKSGYGIIFEPQSIVIHEHTKGTIETNYSREKVKQISYRNQFIFVWKNITDLDLKLQHLVWLPYHFIKAVIRTDWPFIIGFFEAFIMLPKIIKLKLINRKIYIKSDMQLLENIK